eukprot:scaffold388285_cov38-Prasinocladus_malaysianus.AAC.1
MMKAGVIDEMIDDMMEGQEDEEFEAEADDEVEKVGKTTILPTYCCLPEPWHVLINILASNFY